MCGLVLNQPALQSELRCRESPVHVQGFFHCLSPGNNFVIGFRVAYSAGILNWGTTEIGFTERGFHSLRSAFLIAKKILLDNDTPLIISGWDNRM